MTRVNFFNRVPKDDGRRLDPLRSSETSGVRAATTSPVRHDGKATCPAHPAGTHTACSVSAIVVRPVPTPEEQAKAEARVKWDAPVGHAHAFRLLDIIEGRAA